MKVRSRISDKLLIEGEWYVKPRQPPEYYKCDQFSGLEELLKDLGVC